MTLRFCLFLVIDLAIAGILLYSGIIHMSGPYFFYESIAEYELIPSNWLPLVTPVLIYLMLTLGLCIVSGIFKPASLACAFALFFTFAVAQGIAIYNGSEIGCGCFGASSESVGLKTVTLPIIFALLTLFSFCQRTSEKLESKTGITDGSLSNGSF